VSEAELRELPVLLPAESLVAYEVFAIAMKDLINAPKVLRTVAMSACDGSIATIGIHRAAPTESELLRFAGQKMRTKAAVEPPRGQLRRALGKHRKSRDLFEGQRGEVEAAPYRPDCRAILVDLRSRIPSTARRGTGRSCSTDRQIQ